MYSISFIFTLIIILPFFIVFLVALLHIYNPQIRWVWCMLHSSWQNWTWLQLENLQQTVPLIGNWLYCLTNTYCYYKRGLLINLFYAPTIIHSYNLLDKTRFIEDILPLTINADWCLVWPFIILIVFIWQLNLYLECKPQLPQLPDIDPVVRPAKSQQLNNFHFFYWTFFVKHYMPWKFFKLMRLGGIYEFPYNDRSWHVKSRDLQVINHLLDYTLQAALAHASDQFMWPQLKPDLARETYHHHAQCDHIYDTER